MKTNVDLMNAKVPASAIRQHMVKQLSARATAIATPINPEDVAFSKAPEPSDVYNLAYHVAAIDLFFQFMCELNSLEFSMALMVRKTVEAEMQAPGKIRV